MPTSRSDALRGVELCDGVLLNDAGPHAAGFGLCASREFLKGDVVCRDAPLVFVQSSLSAMLAPSCLGCGALLGGSLRQVLVRALSCCSNVTVPGIAGSSLEDFPCLVASGLLDDPRLMLPEPIACSHGCSALFCSIDCRDKQLSLGHHRILCADLPLSSRPCWTEFCSHARKHHETLLLAAYVAAQATCDVLHRDHSAEDVFARYASFFGVPWPELVRPEKAGGEHDRCEWVAKRWDIIRESHEKLLRVFDQRVPGGLEDMFSLEGYARLVGMLDVVSKSLECRNPLDEPLTAVLEGDRLYAAHIELRKVAVLCVTAQRAAQESEEPTSPDESSDDDAQDGSSALVPGLVNLCHASRQLASLSLLPSFDGFGLVPLVALTNHSCAPNVEVKVPWVTQLEMIALRDIQAGEEFLMSYIEEEQPFRARQRDLLGSYGFRCCCMRCLSEGRPADG